MVLWTEGEGGRTLQDFLCVMETAGPPHHSPRLLLCGGIEETKGNCNLKCRISSFSASCCFSPVPWLTEVSLQIL